MNFFEVLITYERYCVLKRTQSGFTRVNLRYIFLISLLVTLLMQLPDIFTRNINYSYSNNSYYFTLNSFGKSDFYFWYQILMMSFVRIVTIVAIIVLNIFNVIEYKKFIRNKIKMVKTSSKLNAEFVFARMIIIGTSLFAFGLINITWSYILSQINLINEIYYTPFQNLSIMMSQQIMLLVLIIDIFLYTILDSNLVKSLRKTYFNKKEITF